jgi:hypothetical protein
MTDRLFNRRCVVLVGRPPPADNFVLSNTGLRISDLRCTFKVVRKLKPEPNPCEVTITNLAESTRNQLEGKGFRVILQAGYGDQVSQLFSGDVRTFDHEHQRPDWITKILAGDGDRAFKFARVSQSFAPGTQIKEVVKAAARALMSDPGSALQKAEQLVGEFSSGYAHHGGAADELTSLLEPFGWEWSMQDGRIELLGPGEHVGEEGPLISPETGLVGSPTVGAPEKVGFPPVLKCRSLLQPRLRPGQRFELRAHGRHGFYRCRQVVHQGDTAGGDWYTDIEAWT